MTEFSSTRDAYGNALASLGEKYDFIVVDADLSVSTMTCLFAKKYPKRFFNVGCAEQNLFGVSAGLALSGKVVFASTYSMFGVGRAWEVIRGICHDKLNVKFFLSHGGLTDSVDGASHQCLEDYALMRVLPNMTVLSPADATETKKAVEEAISLKGPVYARLNRVKTPVIYDDSYPFKIGKASTLRDGQDIAIIACGTMVSKALEAHETLNEKGVSAMVLNYSTIKPFDGETLLRALRKTGALVTCEEHNVIGGLGSAVSEFVSKEKPVPLSMVGVRDLFGQSGSERELYDFYGLTKDNIVKTCMNLIKVR